MIKKTLWLLIACAILALPQVSCRKGIEKDYPISPIPLTSVRLSDEFWAPRLETNRSVSIPFALGQSELTGRIKNFEIAGGLTSGSFCSKYPFDDSDVFKIIEGASYSLMTHPDPGLEKQLDEIIVKIAAAQEDDGYLYTARTIDPDHPPVDWVGKERWSNLSLSHELYNLGHLYEAAVAHFKATGKRNLLNVAIKSAELVAEVFGPGKLHVVPGHQEIEIGLVKLYRITGKKKYLRLAKFFLDERGNAKTRKLYGEYSQDHKPVVDQTEAVGHAVRAMYMYSGMADVSVLAGDPGYLQALDRLWEDVAFRKMYVTGGIGAAGGIEGFGPAYELPNAEAYCETCAAIAFALWNHRMFLFHGDAKYIDLLERTLYNGFLSGVGLSGDLFFYPNPLESFGQHHRSPWFSCACCPSNVVRFVPQIPGLMFAARGDSLYVNLFATCRAEFRLAGQKIGLEQQTGYPWDGEIRLTVSPELPVEFGLHIRIPGWAVGRPVPSDLYRYQEAGEAQVVIKINGEPVPADRSLGYATFRRTWKAGDTVDISLPMPVRRVVAHEAVKADVGKVALERGPIVYCAEWPDNGGQVSNLVLPDDSVLSFEKRADLLNGMTVIKGEAMGLYEGPRAGQVTIRKQALTAIPYYAWAHRGEGEMAVWLPREQKGVRPLPGPTIASRSRASASGDKAAAAVNDLWEPSSSGDHSRPYLHWWPNKGTVEWVQYDFDRILNVSGVQVYWFDDTGRGECRVPESWRVLYRIGDDWLPVSNLNPYGTEKDTFNRVRFKPVLTRGLRLEIQLQKDFSAGVLEWKVE